MTLTRTLKYLMIVAVIAIFGQSFNSCGCADDFDPSQFNPAQFDEYERQLNALLLTRRDEEKEFIGKVVLQVREGKIPSKLVQTSYQWIRNERPNTNYPFIYFEKVLRLQAGKLKLEDDIPPFDFSIYKSAGQKTQGQNAFAGQRTAAQRAFSIRSATGRSAGQKR